MIQTVIGEIKKTKNPTLCVLTQICCCYGLGDLAKISLEISFQNI
jgi:hypothetical protein